MLYYGINIVKEKLICIIIEGNNFSVLRYPGVLDFSVILNEILEFKGEYK